MPVADSATKPTPDRLAATLAPLVADPNLGALTGRITDAITGAQLWAQGADVPMQPASTNKVLTTAAALLALDRDARLTTRVMTEPDSPASSCSRAAVTRLCRRRPPARTPGTGTRRGSATWPTRCAAAASTSTTVQVDIGAYSGPTMAPGWDPADIDGGDIAPMEAVMLDGGRTQPVSVESRRSTTPALDAGRALAVALKVDPADGDGAARGARSGQEIASVQSPPLIERLRQDDERIRQRDGRVDRP